ncbi:c-type cytochrome [Ovoidimarina sediminis]|uniref:c-type cytochrome n=1 Tax=Ovoidimarina sediminis TaxID=3079856 RepID=UPI0029152C9F|nr:cytochrome c [Rhodophyticola sp. MJ-SS7]MDU8942140.1 cytochrome c [Rhodophyticola sp. MJ-SS7]
MRHTVSPILTTLMLAMPVNGLAQEPGDGDVLFQEHCAVCHGRDARGDGPMAQVLTLVPPDLTGLSARAGGTFPAAAIVRWIDGRDTIPSHGGPMPLFGRLLQGESAVIDGADGSPVFTTRAIYDIVAWLEEIQEE